MPKALKQRRGEALRELFQEYPDTPKIEVCRAIAQTEEEAQLYRRRLTSYQNFRHLMPVRSCFEVEKELTGQVVGRLVCEVLSEEKDEYKSLCTEFGLSQEAVVAADSRRSPLDIRRGKVLDEAMKKIGLTLDQLAARLNEAGHRIAPSTIRNMCHGWNRVTDKWAIAMAPILGIAPSDLLLSGVPGTQAESPRMESPTPAVNAHHTGNNSVPVVTLEDLGVALPPLEFTYKDGKFVGPAGYILQREGEVFRLRMEIVAEIAPERILDALFKPE